MDNFDTQMGQCDWIMEQADELKALFAHKSDEMIRLNRERALANIESIRSSLEEIESFVNE